MPTAAESIRFIDWLNAHEPELAAHAGMWVVIHPVNGIIAASEDLTEAKRAYEQKYPGDLPYLYKVPHESEGPYLL